MAFYNVEFVSEADVGRLESDVLFIPGGDTFALAEAIGAPGLGRLEKWIADGGTFVGICAGAYLPLTSSLPPLNSFNIVSSRVRNLSKSLPPAKRMLDKFSNRYGCYHVFHPVRGPVLLDFGGIALTAPMYGGPSWEGPGEAGVLASYTGFTSNTLFLTDPDIAEDTMIGRPAALRKDHGRGALFLFGPHFEHPDHPMSNGVIGSVLQDCRLKSPPSGKRNEIDGMDSPQVSCARELRRLISNARIACLGLEGARWRIGQKTWDSERIGYFIDAVWRRLPDSEGRGSCPPVPQDTVEVFTECLSSIKAIRAGIIHGTDTTELAEPLIRKLSTATSDFLASYLGFLRGNRWAPPA